MASGAARGQAQRGSKVSYELFLSRSEGRGSGVVEAFRGVDDGVRERMWSVEESSAAWAREWQR